MTKAELIEEIRQISVQYQAEVGRGRKAWPRAIKDRITELYKMGLAGAEIAKSTKLPYGTVLKWRPGGKGAPRGIHARKFKELTVALPEPPSRSAKSVPVLGPPRLNEELTTVTVITPDGYQLKVNNVGGALAILQKLRGAPCF